MVESILLTILIALVYAVLFYIVLVTTISFCIGVVVAVQYIIKRIKRIEE